MAVGNSASLNAATVNAAVAALAQNLYGQYQYWLKQYAQLNGNIGNAAQLSAAGITVTADQNQIIALIGDLNRLIQVFQGTNPGTFTAINNDCTAMLGVA